MVQSMDAHTYMTTFSLSKGGCGLAWSGPRPKLGTVVNVRLVGGKTAASLRAMICWVNVLNRAIRVGVRFVSGEDAKLSLLLSHFGANAAEE